MSEIWREIPGYERLYEVSDQGRVRSLDRLVTCGYGSQRRARGRLRKLVSATRKDTVAYLTITLSKDGRTVLRYVHRLVAAAFLGQCPAGLEVCHGPLGTLNNSVANLRYGTHGSNELDKQRDGTSRCRPVRNSNGEIFSSLTAAASATRCPLSKIWEVCNGRRHTTQHLKWEYV